MSSNDDNIEEEKQFLIQQERQENIQLLAAETDAQTFEQRAIGRQIQLNQSHNQHNSNQRLRAGSADDQIPDNISSASSQRSNVGFEMQFGQMRQNLSRQQVSQVKWEVFTDFLVLILVIWLLEINAKDMKQNKQECGIPVLQWLEVFFTSFGVRSCSQLLKIWVIRNYYRYRLGYDLLKLLVIDGFMIGWLIYGNTLYYSEKNDCSKNDNTSFLIEFMHVILLIGYIQMAVYFIILCTIPCIYLYVRHQMRIIENQREMNAGQIPQAVVPLVLQSLSRVNYDPQQFTHENQCMICLNEYKESDIITQLDCDRRHYFHTECLENWIKSGKNQCPFCRKPIQILEVEDDQLSDVNINVN